LQPNYPAWAILRGANSIIGVTATTIGAIQAIDVNVAGGGAGGGLAQLQVRSGAAVWTDVGYAGGNLRIPTALLSEYLDDAVFTPDTDMGMAVGGYAGLGNVVNAGDFGAFAMSIYREQFVSISQNGTITSVQPTWMQPIQDEATNSLAVGAGNYGYYGAGAINQRMRPFLCEFDDGIIAQQQIAQLVINENYYYDTIEAQWQSWQGALGCGDVAVHDGAGTAIDSEAHHADQGLDVVEITGVNDINSWALAPGVAPPTQMANVTPIRWVIFSARQTNAGNMLIGTAAVVHLTIPPGVCLPRMDCPRGINLNSFWCQGAAGDWIDVFYGQSF